MSDLPVTRLARRSVAGARVVSFLAVAAATVVLIGWATGYAPATAAFLPGPTMKTNAAICGLCSGLAHLLFLSTASTIRRRLALTLSMVSATIGTLTLSEHLVGWDLGIDQLLFTEAPGALATASPNRMGPPASVAHILLCLSLFMGQASGRRWRARAQVVALAVCVMTLLPLIGFAFGYSELYSVARLTGISLANALMLLSLACAVQAGRPDSGLPSLLCREDEAGVFARRLLPAIVLLPFGIGWAMAALLNRGMTDAPFALSGMALALILALLAITWRTGALLIRAIDVRTATERELSERERLMREADRQKGEFLATLSHELRNPLAPIRFAVELLKTPGASAERARQTIDRQLRHLTRLVDDLLDLTRITEGKLQLHVRACELRQLVQDAVEAVAAEMTRQKHRVTIDVPAQPIWLDADPDRVVQMLVNLLTNASRYSDPEGTIVIGAEVDRGDVTIFVRDSGHGIAGADLERVFERFVQVGHSRQSGLGIGLALVRALAELHGGSVVARSAGLGQGSEFRLRLPRAMAIARADVAVESLAITPQRVLVVDDNRDAAEMLAAVLASAGHRVEVANSGQEALRIATAFLPDVGLLDLSMPGMDGFELAQALRRQPRHRDLLLVAVTGWGQEHDRQRALAAGFDAHLTKPADVGAIAALLSTRASRALEQDSATG